MVAKSVRRAQHRLMRTATLSLVVVIAVSIAGTVNAASDEGARVVTGFYSVRQVTRAFAAHGVPIGSKRWYDGHWSLGWFDFEGVDNPASGSVFVDVWPPHSRSVGRDPSLSVNHTRIDLRNVAVGYSGGQRFRSKVLAAIAQLRRTKPALS
jgi:hypothetical protein